MHKLIALAAGLAALALALPAPAPATVAPGTTLLLSKPTLGGLPPGLVNSSSLGSGRAVSATGRYVVFASSADGLLPSGSSPSTQVFLRDRQANTTTLISRGADGAPANGFSYGATVSGDGTQVVFLSQATNLVEGAGDGVKAQVFVRNLTAGTTAVVSRATGSSGAVGNGFATDAEISADGGAVAFTSASSNLDGAKTDTTTGVFVRHLDTDTTELASRLDDGAGGSNAPSSSQAAISGDGKIVAFVSSTDNLGDPDNVDANGQPDVFVRDLANGKTRVASRAGATGDPVGTGVASAPSLSADGFEVAFVSTSDLTGSLVDDGNGVSDVYVRALSFSGTSGTTALISRVASAAGNGPSNFPVISGDAGAVVFESDASDLVSGDGNGGGDVFLRSGATTTVLTRTPDGAVAGKAFSPVPSLSGDGSTAAFSSGADDLSTLDDDDYDGVYAVATAGGPVEHIARPGAPTDVFEGGVGQSLVGGATAVDAGGRRTVFTSTSDSLSTEDDDHYANVFVADAADGSTTLVSRADGAGGAPAHGDSVGAAISADGRRVAFATGAALDPADTNAHNDVYVRDLVAQTTRLVSRASGGDGAVADNESFGGSLDADGGRVAFSSLASNLGAGGDADYDGFVRDLDTNETTLVTVADGAGGASADGNAFGVTLDAAGTHAAFVTVAGNLGPTDTDGRSDAYVRDLAAGTTTLASVEGADGPSGETDSNSGVISADGRHVAFASTALAAGAKAGVYVRDLAAGTTTLASRADGASGAAAQQLAANPSISADGYRVAFGAFQGDLTGEAPASSAQVYVRDLAAGRTLLVSRADGASGAPQAPAPGGLLTLWSSALSGDGHCAAFAASDPLAAGVVTSDFTHVYLRAVDAECAVIPPAPEPAPTTGGGTPAPAKDTTPPVVESFSPSRKRFAVDRKPTAVSAKKKKTPKGTTFRFKLSEAASIAIVIEREEAGRRSGKSCKKPTRKLRKKKTCTRRVKVGTLKRASLKAGSGTLKFTGRVGSKALRRARHRATITATDAAGNRSRSRSAKFTVVR